MNAIPLIFNAPKANINVNSVSPINVNSIRTNNKLINATQGMNIGGAAGMLGGGGFSNEAQLRQEVNTSIVALKREAFSLENLIAQAAQTLQDINKRLSELEGKQGDYVKKADATVDSVGGDGKYISAISETDGKINATATDLGNMVPVNSVTSGNLHSVTSGAVYQKFVPIDITSQITINTNYCNSITIIKYDKIIDVTFSTKMVAGSNINIAQGLPLPKSGQLMYGVQVFGTGSIAYCRVESYGFITAQSRTDSAARGHIIYVSE
jgi:hypothetical protein